MATAQRVLTLTTDQTPAVVNVSSKELSGVQWVSRFPTSRAVSDLSEKFQSNVNQFISAVQQAGGSVSIAATYRPKERAFLMHYSHAIANEKVKAGDVPEMAGVTIDWEHGTLAKSKAAAAAMVAGYAIVYAPSLVSRHTERNAIDMTISGIKKKTMKDASGVDVLIQNDSDLYKVGASFGVKKLVTDPPHWSVDGT